MMSQWTWEHCIILLHLVKFLDIMGAYRMKAEWSIQLFDDWLVAPKSSSLCHHFCWRLGDHIDFKEGWTVLSLKQYFFDALQHLALYNFNKSIATAPLKNPTTVALSFIF